MLQQRDRQMRARFGDRQHDSIRSGLSADAFASEHLAVTTGQFFIQQNVRLSDCWAGTLRQR